MTGTRALVVVLGDPLDPTSAAFDGFVAERDGVFMAEVSAAGESVCSHEARIAPFLSTMRHFATSSAVGAAPSSTSSDSAPSGPSSSSRASGRCGRS